MFDVTTSRLLDGWAYQLTVTLGSRTVTVGRSKARFPSRNDALSAGEHDMVRRLQRILAGAR